MSSILISSSMNIISATALEVFVSDRLNAFQKRPLMFGSPESIENQAFSYLELLNIFCWDNRFDLRDEYQKLCRATYPKRPGPFPLHYWLQDKEYGLGLEDKDAGQQAANFFITLLQELKNKI